MSLKKEKDLYPKICSWLEDLLKSYYPKKTIYSYDTSNIYLSKFIQDHNWISYRSDYVTYQIKIDILGIIIKNETLDFVFVEVKNTKISLKDLKESNRKRCRREWKGKDLSSL